MRVLLDECVPKRLGRELTGQRRSDGAAGGLVRKKEWRTAGANVGGRVRGTADRRPGHSAPTESTGRWRGGRGHVRGQQSTRGPAATGGAYCLTGLGNGAARRCRRGSRVAIVAVIASVIEYDK